MSTPTMKQILEQTRALVSTKQAEFKMNLQGGEKRAKGLDTAGAGDDSTITRGHALEADQSALEPTKKPLLSSDAKANPPSDGSGTSGEKAKGKNEGNQTDRTDALEADESALQPAKKPELSADANAKKATATLCNDLLKDIRTYQSTKAAAMPPALAKAKEEKKDVKKEEKKEDKPVESTEVTAAAKQATGPQMELTTDVMAKIAAMILSTEEGSQYVEQMLAKEAGKEAALETLSFLAEQSELAEKQAAYQQGQADADALIQQAIFQAGVEQGQKQAAAAGETALYTKLGQAVADAGIEDLMAQAGGAAGGVPPEALAGGEAAGGAEGEVSMDELGQALEALVQDGTLKPEEAQQVMEYLAQAEQGGGEAPAEAAPAEAAPAEAAPAEAAPAKDDAAKEGSVKAAALLDQIRQIRKAQSK